MKFLNQRAFYHTITMWIRDGWELRVIHHNPHLEQFFLAKDGIQETLVLFYKQEMYDNNNTDLIAAAE